MHGHEGSDRSQWLLVLDIHIMRLREVNNKPVRWTALLLARPLPSDTFRIEVHLRRSNALDIKRSERVYVVLDFDF